MIHRTKNKRSSSSEILSQKITATDDPGDSETAIAMHVIVAALTAGPNTERSCRETGYDIRRIQPMAERLREAKLWGEGSVDDREWATADERQMMWVLFLQAHVARGLLLRKVVENVASYVAPDGKEVERIVIPDGCGPS